MRYYFLGICGTAMASLAVLLKQKGHQVWGSDENVYPPMSDFLAQNKIAIREGFQLENLDTPFDVAVIGNALSRGNPEVEAILDRRLPYASLTDIIRREFAQPLKSIVLAGTHGKTTTTALMTWLLESAGYSPTFLIGGVSRNLQTSARLGSGDLFVIEGDEYDSAFFDKRPKFLSYFPFYLSINNIEYDHSDIYRNVEEIKENFRKLLRCIPRSGLVSANGDDPNIRQVIRNAPCRVVTFGLEKGSNWQAHNIRATTDGSIFTVRRDGQKWGEFSIPLFGEFQVLNTLSLLPILMDIGLSAQQIQQGLNSFLPVRRRLESWGKLNGALFFDDFAHHPTAIQKTLRAVRTRFPGKRLVAVFEPRTNTTVRNIFQKELASALSEADVVLLAPLHRQERIPVPDRLSREKIRSDLEKQGCEVLLLEHCKELLTLLPGTVKADDVVVLMTNGSLDGWYTRVRELVQTKGPAMDKSASL